MTWSVMSARRRRPSVVCYVTEQALHIYPASWDPDAVTELDVDSGGLLAYRPLKSRVDTYHVGNHIYYIDDKDRAARRVQHRQMRQAIREADLRFAILMVKQQEEGRPASPKACTKASRFLDTLAILLPSRIVNEDLGDFLEDINRRAGEGQSPTKIYLRTAAATFWLMVNTVGYLARAIGARKSA